MSTTLSIRLDDTTKDRLEALSKKANRTKSFLAAEAIAAYVAAEEWQLGEIHAGILDADAGRTVRHDKVASWLNSWGKPGEKKAPK